MSGTGHLHRGPQRRRGRFRPSGSTPPPERVELVGVGRHAGRTAPSTRRASTPLNANAQAVLKLLRDDWQPGGLLAKDAGLSPQAGAAGLRELRVAGLAEGRVMGNGRFGLKEWRRS